MGAAQQKSMDINSIMALYGQTNSEFVGETEISWAILSFISIQISIHFNNQFFLIYSAGEIAHSYQILPNIIEIS